MAWRVEHVHSALPIGRLKASLAQLNGEPARLEKKKKKEN